MAPDRMTVTASPSEPNRAALARVLSAPEFAQAPRLSQFLTYVAEESLAGRGAAIKGYTIATAVYGRPADFDPNADPLVRVEAGRLRKALSQYYQTAGASDPVQLDMPRGAYAVTFAARGMAVPETQAAALPPAAMPHTPPPAVRPPINPFYLVGSVAALATLALLIWQIATAPALPPANPAPPPAAAPVIRTDGSPMLAFEPFRPLGSNSDVGFISEGLKAEIVAELLRYKDLAVFTQVPVNENKPGPDGRVAATPDWIDGARLHGRLVGADFSLPRRIPLRLQPASARQPGPARAGP
jgi:adenylate cyclase